MIVKPENQPVLIDWPKTIKIFLAAYSSWHYYWKAEIFMEELVRHNRCLMDRQLRAMIRLFLIKTKKSLRRGGFADKKEPIYLIVTAFKQQVAKKFGWTEAELESELQKYLQVWRKNPNCPVEEIFFSSIPVN
jgi:hypothetical protein